MASELELATLYYIRVLTNQYPGIPEPQQEYRFHPKRLWRFDFAWPDRMVAVEVQGGTWVRGRHNRASHISKEYEKLNTAVLLGWRIVQLSTDMVRDGSVYSILGRLLTKEYGI